MEHGVIKVIAIIFQFQLKICFCEAAHNRRK